MRVLKTFRGAGELQVGADLVPVNYELQAFYLEQRRAIDGRGWLTSKQSLAPAFMSGAAMPLIMDSGESVQVIITRLSGNTAEIGTSGIIPGVDVSGL